MSTTTDNAVCDVAGCHARTHGRGLCRLHYDEARYLETTGRSPEAQEAAARERAIEAELCFGSVPRFQSPNGTDSMFASEREHREAWDARRDDLLRSYLTPPRIPGNRPEAWWRFEAGRPKHLEPYPLRLRGSIEERADAVDEYEIEPVVFLARRGELREDELAELEAAAAEAAERVGTDSERIGSGGVDRVDQRKVKLWNAVKEANMAIL